MAATQTLMVPIRVRAPHGAGESGSNKIHIELQAEDQPRIAVSARRRCSWCRAADPSCQHMT
jgi:hypothetical protein